MSRRSVPSQLTRASPHPAATRWSRGARQQAWPRRGRPGRATPPAPHARLSKHGFAGLRMGRGRAVLAVPEQAVVEALLAAVDIVHPGPAPSRWSGGHWTCTKSSRRRRRARTRGWLSPARRRTGATSARSTR
jgi:hypothetical protein